MAFSDTWNESYPAGSTPANELDTAITQGVKRALRERLAVDHEFESSETSSYIGAHKKVHLVEIQGSDPTNYTDTGYLYLKDANSKAELHWIDEDGNVTQLTSAGKLVGSSLELENDTWLTATDNAGTGTVNMIKVDTNDVVVLADGVQTATNAAAVNDKDLVNKKHVDDTFAVLAAVNSRENPLAVGVATGTDDQQAPASESDMNDMSVTITTYGTKALIMFTAPFYTTSQGADAMVYINVDSSNKSSHRVWIYSNLDNVCFMHLETGLTPGSHTFKIRWVGVGSQNIRQRGSTDAARRLVVLDID